MKQAINIETYMKKQMTNIETIMCNNGYAYKLYELKYAIANILFERNSNYTIIEDKNYQEIYKFKIDDNDIIITEINSNYKVIIKNDTNKIIEYDDIIFDIDYIERIIELIKNNTIHY